MAGFLLRHTGLRRLCTFAALALVCAVAIVLVPLALLVGRGGQARTARFAAFAGAYLGAELAGLAGAARLRRDDRERHYALLARLLARLLRTSQRAFRLRVSTPDGECAVPDGPLIVLSRHAGPGDSFLLAYALLALGRHPRIVAKETLRLDPLIDVVLGRTPNCFVGHSEPARAAAADCIGTLSATLGPRDALVIFPEGGNFTTARRSRLIHRLHRRRDRAALSTAASLSHVLPPRPSGVFAAIDAAPADSRVVFLAHTGLDHLETVAETWRAVPLGEPLRFTWWDVGLSQIPAEEDARQAWLNGQWERIDAWLDLRHDELAAQRVRDALTTGRAPSA
ncbi:MAG TPA: 1-acyl-sn-glycerol-3-phosphate acyltransferase [Actinospica sp.]|nr:1-acyl-sn-glycerol-3-phosphate acyltransferase [Actinospica sp.]